VQKSPRALSYALILFATLSAAQTPQASDLQPITRNGVTFAWKSIKLTAKDNPGENTRPDLAKLEVTPGYGTLTASWPQARSDAPDWAAWNKSIEAAAQKMSQSDTGPDRPSSSQWAAQPGVDATVTVALGVVEKPLVTATIQAMWDGHGAHPNHGSTELNWLLDQQRELQPEDVFEPGSDWAQSLQSRTNAYLHKQLDQDGKSYEDFMQKGEMQKTLHKIVINPENWHLDSRGLSIVFQPYAVACYACTPPPFTIPWTELKPILNTGFTVPTQEAALPKP
jgi:Protein of unknown function (DUF3298)